MNANTEISSPAAARPARRRRPHPARRARRIVGATGVTSLLVLTGAMTIAANQNASASAATSAATSATTAASTSASKSTATATAATPASTASSASKGS